MLSLLDATILCFAVWRISYMFVREKGPFNIFYHIRDALGIVHDDEKIPYAVLSEGYLSMLFSCVYCFSMTLSFFVIAFWAISPSATVLFLLPFAVSAGAIMVGKING